jgi:sugar phosphate isomerase/epimerase
MAIHPLTGFVDEISPELSEQVRVARACGLTGIDVRSVGGVNVLDLTDEQLAEVRQAAADAGLSVQSVGSPVNKVAFSAENRGKEVQKLRRALHAARILGAKRIRIFSPEVPEGEHEARWSEVLAWMAEHADIARTAHVLLLHENDGRYYGAYPANAKRMMEALHSPNFRFAFDFANTVQLGFSPVEDWLPWVLPYTDTIHVKDAVKGTGQVVPAGKGDGQIEEFLKVALQEGWRGTFTMEPHLEVAGSFGGFSGAQLFGAAVRAFRDVIVRAGGTAGW